MSCSVPADRLVQSVTVHVPGVTKDLINLELFNVMDEFLRRTNAWHAEVPIQLNEQDVKYTLTLPGDAAVVRLLAVTHNDIQLYNASDSIWPATSQLPAELTFDPGDPFTSAPLSYPVGTFAYKFFEPDAIIMTTVPTQDQVAYPLRVVLALTVSTTRCGDCDCGDWDIPEWMWDMYFTAWYDGVLSRLYAMPSKPWSSERHAIVHSKKFRNRMAFRKQEARRGFSYNTPTWRFPPI